MKQFVQQYHRHMEWALGIGVVIASISVWLVNREPSLSSITIYDIFPVLGLIAFGLMWTHFVMDAVRKYYTIASVKNGTYKTASFGIVLALLILHPGLLWIGLYQDGYGLPPGSHVDAYQGQLLAVGLGTVALMIFLSFELRRWFSKKSWWKFVGYAQIVGMAAIFYHAIELGGELRQDWFALLWWFYGITLAAAIIYVEIAKRRKAKI